MIFHVISGGQVICLILSLIYVKGNHVKTLKQSNI